jgi:hypothetical protein
MDIAELQELHANLTDVIRHTQPVDTARRWPDQQRRASRWQRGRSSVDDLSWARDLERQRRGLGHLKGLATVTDIHPDNFGAGSVTEVGDGCLDGDGHRVTEWVYHDVETGVAECGVGQALAKRVVDVETAGVEPAVADEDSLVVPDVAGLAGKVQVGGEVSSSRTGTVSGNLPEGMTSPSRMSATLSPWAWPVNQNSTMLPTESRQVLVVTAEPLLRATTTRGLPAVTASISSSWSAGRSMLVRSRPSAS